MPSCRSAQQQALGVGDQGTKVGHGAHAHENKAGIDAQLDTQVQHIDQTDADSDITEGNAIGGEVLLGSYQGVQLVGQRAHGLGAAGGKLCHQVIEHTGVERTLRRRHQGSRRKAGTYRQIRRLPAFPRETVP